MEMKGKDEEEARSWKEACAIVEETNVKVVELKMMTRYFREATNDLFETRKKMRNDTLLSHLGNGNANKYPKSQNHARM
jgi:hypothetical protein